MEPAKGGPGRIYPSRRCSRRPRAVLPLQPRRRWPPPRGQYRESLAFSRGAAHEALPAKHPRTTAAATTAGWGAALSTDVVRAEVSLLGPRGGRIPSFAREAPQPAQAKQPKSNVPRRCYYLYYSLVIRGAIIILLLLVVVGASRRSSPPTGRTKLQPVSEEGQRIRGGGSERRMCVTFSSCHEELDYYYHTMASSSRAAAK